MKDLHLSPPSVRFGVFEVDFRAVELRKHGVRIKLQEQPFKILELLVAHPGELVARDELRRSLWPADTFVDFDRSLNKAINKLRVALCDSAENPRFIETVPRHGYRFIAPVQRQGAESTEETTSGALRATGLSASGARPSPDRGNAGPRAGLWRAGLAGFLVLVLGALAMLFHRRVMLQGASPKLNPRRSVAVLGFVNLSGRSDEAWLSTALSDWLTTELAAGEELRTIPEERVTRMKVELALSESDSLDRSSLARIGKNLGADVVVVGSYGSLDPKFGNQIRFDLRLEDTRSGETVAAISEEGVESNLFSLVSRAGARLRASLGVHAATAEETAEVGVTLPRNPEAARMYAEGLAKLRLFDALAARNLLEKAVALEPSSALGHSALASAWSVLGYDAQAKAEAAKAFDLCANLPRAERLLIEGRYREASRDCEGAIEIYRALVEFFPDNLDYGLALAGAQVRGGRGKDALATAATLKSLPSPLRDDPRIDFAAANAAESQGDYKTDLASAARAAAKARTAGDSLLLAQARTEEAWALENLGEPDRAITAVAEAKRLFAAAGDARSAARATTVYAIALDLQGDTVGSKRMFEESLGIYRQIGNQYGVATSLNNVASTLHELGDLAGARQGFEESMAIYRSIGHQDGVALTESNLGEVLLALGELTQAKRMYEESLAICREVGDKSKAAGDLAGLGQIYRAEGDLQEASKYDAEAKSAFEASGDRLRAAQAQLAQAQLLIEQGRSTEAARAAQGAVEEFRREKGEEYESVSQAVLAQALLGEGDIAGARQKMERALSISSKLQNREGGLFVAVMAARVRAASPSAGDRLEAVQDLRVALGKAATNGFVNYGLEARLAMGEIEMNSGDGAGGRAYLKALEKDAAKRGFGLIAQKAAADLKTGSR